MSAPRAAVPSVELARGVHALPRGLLLLEASRALVAADAHLAYEEVIGGALPLWSTAESVATLLLAIERTQARELILLGDVIHGTRMSDGATRIVGDALDLLRTRVVVTLIAGNHEGRTRGCAVLGETEDATERDGWSLLHGDRPVPLTRRCIVGHLHPSIALGGDQSVPAFLATPRVVVVPALTPYSRGLNVLSQACTVALKAFMASTSDVSVVACGDEKVYPFGSLTALRGLVRNGLPAPRYRRRRLSWDGS